MIAVPESRQRRHQLAAVMAASQRVADWRVADWIEILAEHKHDAPLELCPTEVVRMLFDLQLIQAVLTTQAAPSDASL